MVCSRGVRRRDAMGEFIPSPGCAPLTGLSGVTPGPAHYQLPDLNVTRSAAPAHFLAGKTQERPPPAAAANAASYDTRKKRSRHSLAVTLKARVAEPDYRCSPGPVHLVTAGDISRQPGRVSLKSVPGAAATVGLPSPLDRGVTSAPAPVYDPVTAHLPSAAAFSLAGRLEGTGSSLGPGPGCRGLPSPPPGPRFCLTSRPRPVTPPTWEFPGPGCYDPVPVTPSCRAPVIGQKLRPRGPSPTPPPNAYRIRPGPARGPQLTFRPFESDDSERKTPGPASYSPEKPPGRRAPAFTMSALTEGGQGAATSAGPASYKLSRETAQRPGYSFGLKTTPRPSGTPAPNHYRPHSPPGTRQGFPLVSRKQTTLAAHTPAPNAYTPRATLRRAPQYPLGLKFGGSIDTQKQTGPSPAEYSPVVGGGCGVGRSTKPGASLKGRASRYVYSGFDATKTLGSMSEHAERTRPIIY